MTPAWWRDRQSWYRTPGFLYGRVRHLHRDERLIAWATRPAGRVAVVLVAAGLLLAREHPLARLACASIALVQLAPDSRREILSLAGVFVLYTWAARQLELATLAGPQLVGLLVVIGCAAAATFACYRLARSFRALPRFVRRRPQLLLHAAILSLVLLAALLPAPGSTAAVLATAVAAALAGFAWRLGYVLISGKRGSAAKTRLRDHFFYVWPVFGGTSVPYGKGFDHLARHEARSAEAFARAQLGGIKLLCLAWLWQGVSIAIGGALHGDPHNPVAAWLGDHALGLPRLPELIAGASADQASWPLRWVAVLMGLVTRTLELAIEGHVIVGVLRLVGYDVFRNTYKPLLSESIVEFWNRFHHYFKELLVEFFFLPTYLRAFKGSPRLRLFAATFAAACVGNVYFHLLSTSQLLLSLPPAEALGHVLPRAFYAALLALGVFVSMLREQRRRGAEQPMPSRLRRVRRIAGVWLFFSLIHIWSVAPLELGFEPRTRFFLSLFGG